ncbi:hypothetical protein D6853_11225 [Butyrivibrio sp. X503]|uniref:hypothetical protein n=1 Tax=Butyrivibrio sp. X503 TaxID=2364878 RepID=UPI000EA8AFBE|nr:hypothetical protein [Butyrivibrio sp. X503]RKM55283.1 hypothetical protein D6853_11225 [Butyrivibrio sp. X503]
MNKKTFFIKKYLILISMLTIFGLTACASGNMTSIKENAKENGYDLESVDDKTVCVEDGEAKYYYTVGAFGASFDRCEITVEEEGVEVKEGEIVVAISDGGKNKRRVNVDDSRIVKSEDGKEINRCEKRSFVSDEEFEESSVESEEADDGVDDGKGNARKAYEYVKKLLSVTQLKAYYDNALIIRDRLNG